MNTDYTEEIKQYYEFAKKVLTEYELDYDDLSFIQKSENITFRIENKTSNEKYLVRIHTSIEGSDDYKDKSLINSELLLLDELNNSKLFNVQAPIKNKCGDLVTQVYNETTNRNLYATVLKWVDGETIDINDSNHSQLSYKLGEDLAKLHKYLKQWKCPDDFIRPIYNIESFKSNLAKLNKLVDLNILSNEEYNLVAKNGLTIVNFIEENSSKDAEWGLIHGDLNEGNYIKNNEDLIFIDFSLCGYGYYLYDIAQTCMHLYPQNRKLFVEGYESQFSLPSNHVKLIESFFILSITENMLFLSSNKEEYDHIKMLANFLIDKLLPKYNSNTPFIFGAK